MGRALSHQGLIALVTVHGTVVNAETGEPLAFSIVALQPGFAEHFTDQAGAFTFTNVSTGTYRLRVRQIGYSPVDTTLTVGSDSDLSIRIALRRVAVELPPITVTGALTCVQPGPPDAAVTPALASVFDQLLENARRYRLLADSFPFTFVIERTSSTGVDTIEQTSGDERHRYRPGRVVDAGTGPWRDRRVVLLPGLEEFGDSAFGAAYLDPGSYQLRYTRVRLTRPERSLPEVLGLVATTRFREIAPGIVLHDRVRAVATLPRQVERIEEQRLLGVRFQRPFPQR